MIDYQNICYKLDSVSGEVWKEAVEHFGLHVTQDPMLEEDCNLYGFFLTREKPTKEQLAEIMRDAYGDELEDHEDMWKYLTPERRKELEDEIAQEEAEMQKGANI